MTWATIITNPHGGADYDPEALPSGFILSADFLNTFCEALDERFHILYPQDEFTMRFESHEIINSVFKDKLVDLVYGYRRLFENYTWVDEYMYDHPEVVNTSYIIEESDIETMLADTDSYKTIFDIDSYQTRWDKLKRIGLWSSLYKLYKHLKVYTVDWEVKDADIVVNRPCLQSVRTFTDILQPIVSGIDTVFPTLATIESDSDTALDASITTLGSVGDTGSSLTADFVWNESNVSQPLYYTWETQGVKSYHDVMDLQCKRKSDDLVLTMEYAVGSNIVYNQRVDAWEITAVFDGGGGTINDSGSSTAIEDGAYTTGRTEIPIIRSQQTPSYASDGTTQLVLDYSYIEDFAFAGITDVYGDIGFRSATDEYIADASCNIFLQCDLLPETYIKVNNSALDYYIAP